MTGRSAAISQFPLSCTNAFSGGSETILARSVQWIGSSFAQHAASEDALAGAVEIGRAASPAANSESRRAQGLQDGDHLRRLAP